jgi:hypothetical protein
MVFITPSRKMARIVQRDSGRKAIGCMSERKESAKEIKQFFRTDVTNR